MKPIQGLFYRDWDNGHIAGQLREMYFESIYEPYMVKDGIYIDAGANVGLFTHYAYPFAKKIYSIEPSEEHFTVLETMVNFNKMDRVVPIKKALSNENGTAKLRLSANITMHSLVPIDHVLQTKETEDVQTIALSDFFAENGIERVDVMKCDIEGEELKVFSSSDFDKLAPRIDTILVEFHAWTNVPMNSLTILFTDRGYEPIRLTTEAFVFAMKRRTV